jgi:uncharacterized protein YycO
MGCSLQKKITKYNDEDNKPEVKNRKKGKKLLLALAAIAVIFIAAFSVIAVLNQIIESDATWRPDYPKVDLYGIASKDVLTEEDYRILLRQTGLAKQAADVIIKTYERGEKRYSELSRYQEDFFSSGQYECRQIGIITFEEKNLGDNGEIKTGFEIPSLKNGDILITKSTHSIGWRHGHAAIVIDASEGKTLEAVVLGENSSVQSISKWQGYTTFALFRIKGGTDDLGEKVARLANEKLNGIPYGLLTGLPQKSPKVVKKTQCSHLVWYPYFQFGYDLDSDGWWLVTPKDIVYSDLVELVQVYGADPENFWP